VHQPLGFCCFGSAAAGAAASAPPTAAAAFCRPASSVLPSLLPPVPPAVGFRAGLHVDSTSEVLPWSELSAGQPGIQFLDIIICQLAIDWLTHDFKFGLTASLIFPNILSL